MEQPFESNQGGFLVGPLPNGREIRISDTDGIFFVRQTAPGGAQPIQPYGEIEDGSFVELKYPSFDKALEEAKRALVDGTIHHTLTQVVGVHDDVASEAIDALNRFVAEPDRVSHGSFEYRVQGHLGFGGKLRTYKEFREGREPFSMLGVDQYREDETPQTKAIVEQANRVLNEITYPI